MLRQWKCDLHVHTVLSPCGGLDMIPGEIVRHARMKGLDTIGITDHNATENVAAVQKAGKKIGIKVMGGMEITSSEEVHILGYFDGDAELKTLQEAVYQNLKGENDESLFGEQVILDEHDNVIDLNSHLLVGSVQMSLRKIVNLIHSLGGLAIASHVDKKRFSMMSQLGFIPRNPILDGFELSVRDSRKQSPFKLPESTMDSARVTFSDAHYLTDIGRASTTFVMEKPCIGEMKKALRGEDGRSVITCS